MVRDFVPKPIQKKYKEDRKEDRFRDGIPKYKNIKMQNLPIGISSFEKIREEGYLYIDKTPYIHQLISTGKYYFLSRPRRFGKSLLVSTLRCLFEGRRELFKGLYIEDKWDWGKRYPVVVVDFNQINCENKRSLCSGLIHQLSYFAQQEGLSLRGEDPQDDFKDIILSLADKYSASVSIIIDEYDKPIVSHLGLGQDRLNLARENRELLKRFFGVIKGHDITRITKFVLLTGVSKFSQVSIFSELNNLTDLTMGERYSAIMGITEQEMQDNLIPYIEHFAQQRNIPLFEIKQQLKLYYNGYRFSEEDQTVYNPYSLFCALQDKKFRNYWFETGTPTFLIDLIKEKEYYIPKAEQLLLPDYVFRQYDLETLQLESLFFQTGYLTIKGTEDRLYRLGYPNQEVKLSFNELLFDNLTNIPIEEKTPFYQIQSTLKQGNLSRCIDLIKSLFAGIPYSISNKQDESYFHTLFYLMLSGSGVFVETEVLTSDGRIDLTAHYPDTIYIFEFKCNQTAKKAIEQIKQKNYPQKYKHIDKPILLVGINFSLETKNVKEWVYENG